MKSKKRGSDLIKKLDKVFSLYIRLRDVMPNGYGRCISCGKIKPFKELDAGHFYSRIHMATRFDEQNVNGECRFCNRFLSDHIIGYRANLIQKIGLGKVEYLGIKSKQTKKWSAFELEEMIKYYKNEVKRLSALKNIPVKI